MKMMTPATTASSKAFIEKAPIKYGTKLATVPETLEIVSATSLLTRYKAVKTKNVCKIVEIKAMIAPLIEEALPLKKFSLNKPTHNPNKNLGSTDTSGFKKRRSTGDTALVAAAYNDVRPNIKPTTLPPNTPFVKAAIITGICDNVRATGPTRMNPNCGTSPMTTSIAIIIARVVICLVFKLLFLSIQTF